MTVTSRRKQEVEVRPLVSIQRQEAARIIREMKLRGGFETDTALADFLGRSQSAVAQWRRKDAVPEGAIVRFGTRMAARAA